MATNFYRDMTTAPAQRRARIARRNKKLPVPLRTAIIVGGSLLLWAAIILPFVL